MAFTLAFVPKPFSPMPSFKTFQQPRRRTIVCGAPSRPHSSSGKGGKIHRVPEQVTSLNSSQMNVKDQLINEMKREAKEFDGNSAKKAKDSN